MATAAPARGPTPARHPNADSPAAQILAVLSKLSAGPHALSLDSHAPADIVAFQLAIAAALAPSPTSTPAETPAASGPFQDTPRRRSQHSSIRDTRDAKDILRLLRAALIRLPVPFFAPPAPASTSLNAAASAASSSSSSTHAPDDLNASTSNPAQTAERFPSTAISIGPTQLPLADPRLRPRFDLWLLDALLWSLVGPSPVSHAPPSDIIDTLSAVCTFVHDQHPDPSFYRRAFLHVIHLTASLESALHSINNHHSGPQSQTATGSFTPPSLNFVPYESSPLFWLSCSTPLPSSFSRIQAGAPLQTTKSNTSLSTTKPHSAASVSTATLSDHPRIADFVVQLLIILERFMTIGSHSLFPHLNVLCSILTAFVRRRSAFSVHALRVPLFSLVSTTLHIDGIKLLPDHLAWGHYIIFGLEETLKYAPGSLTAPTDSTQKSTSQKSQNHQKHSSLARKATFQDILGMCIKRLDQVGLDWLPVTSQIRAIAVPRSLALITSRTLRSILTSIHKNVIENIRLQKSNDGDDANSTDKENHGAHKALEYCDYSAASISGTAWPDVSVGRKRRRVLHTGPLGGTSTSTASTIVAVDHLIGQSTNQQTNLLWEHIEAMTTLDEPSMVPDSFETILMMMRDADSAGFGERLALLLTSMYAIVLKRVFERSHVQSVHLSLLVTCICASSSHSPPADWLVCNMPLLPAMLVIPLFVNATAHLADALATNTFEFSAFAASLEPRDAELAAATMDHGQTFDHTHASRRELQIHVQQASPPQSEPDQTYQKSLQSACLKALGILSRVDAWRSEISCMLLRVTTNQTLVDIWPWTLHVIGVLGDDVDQQYLVKEIAGAAMADNASPQQTIHAFGYLGCLLSGKLIGQGSTPVCMVCDKSINVGVSQSDTYPKPDQLKSLKHRDALKHYDRKPVLGKHPRSNTMASGALEYEAHESSSQVAIKHSRNPTTHVTSASLRSQLLEAWCKMASTSKLRENVHALSALCVSMCRLMQHFPESDRVFLQFQGRELLLTFLSHASRNVRLHAGLAVSRFADVESEELHSENLTVIVDHLSRISRTHPQRPIQETLIVTCGNIARLSTRFSPSNIASVLRFLLEYTGEFNPVLHALAYEEIYMAATSRGINTADLLRDGIQEWSQLATVNIDKNRRILNALACFFGVFPFKFLDSTLMHTLPPLVLHQRLSPLQTIASMLKRSLPDILVDSGGHILAQLLIAEDGQSEGSDPLVYFLEIANFKSSEVPLQRLFRSCRLSLVTNLAVELGDPDQSHRQRALGALCRVEKVLSPELMRPAGAGGVTEPSAAFLGQHLLGILSMMNEHIAGWSISPLAMKTKVLCGLRELVRLCGTTIASVTPQVMGVLQEALEDRALWDATLPCWDILLRCLGAQDLLAVFGQVSTMLLRIEPLCTETQRATLVHLFEGLLVDGPNAAAFVKKMVVRVPKGVLWQRVSHAVQLHAAEFNPVAEMRTVASYLLNENAMVVESALDRLNDLLRHHALVVYQAFLDEDAYLHVREIVQRLFETCQRFSAHSQTITQACCACLGALGALDPTRLNLVMEAEGDFGPKTHIESANDAVAFACLAIEKILAPVFRSTHDSKMQGYLAFTIQELLSYCGFTPEFFRKNDFSVRGDAQGAQAGGDAGVDHHEAADLEKRDRLRQRWSKFPKAVANTIRPLVGARYSAPPPPVPNHTYPIYASKTSTCFREWIRTFCLVTFDRMQPEYTRMLFAVFTSLIKEGDTNIARLLLPHAVLNVLVSQHIAHADDLLCEVLAVLEDNPSPKDNRNRVEMHQLSVQTVFGLVDHLTKWIRIERVQLARQRSSLARRSRYASTSGPAAAAAAATAAAALQERQHQINAVDAWLSRIPRVIMAQASVRCRSYARAFMHYEQHVRALRLTHSTIEMQSTYADLQRIYAQLDEPDGLQGISSLVLSPTLDQQIVVHESTSQWSEALTCYELALQSDAGNTEYQLGLLRCLHQLGHYQTLLSHVNGAVERRVAGAERLCAQGLEAAWRLGDWATLRQLLDQPHTHGFQASLGRILLSLVSGDECGGTVHQLMAQARGELTTSIAAASLESYSRGHDATLQLAMLHEVEGFHRILADLHQPDDDQTKSALERLATSLQDTLSAWDARLEITMPAIRVREPILNLRRVLLGIMISRMDGLHHAVSDSDSVPTDVAVGLSTTIKDTLSCETGRLWLQTSRESRKAGSFQVAHAAALRAAQTGTPRVYVEHAKTLWAQGHRHQAIFELRSAMDREREKAEAAATAAANGASAALAGLAGTDNGTLTSVAATVTGAAGRGGGGVTEGIGASTDALGSRLYVSQDPDRLTAPGDDRGTAALDPSSESFQLAKANLLLTRWIEGTSGLHSAGIIAAYQAINKDHPQWEKSAFHLGRYYNRLRESEVQKLSVSKSRSPQVVSQTFHLVQLCCKMYARALAHGTKYIYQMMPRLLTLWLDFGNAVLEIQSSGGGSSNGGASGNGGVRPEDDLLARFAQLNRMVRKLSMTLPTYQFLMVIQQLVSRICHKNQQVQQVLDGIIVNVLSVYPQQTLWHLMSVGKSTVKTRVRRVMAIFSKLRSDAAARHIDVASLETLIQEAHKLTDQLLHLSNFAIPRDVTTMSMSKDFRALQRMAPLSMIVPLQSSMTVALPAPSSLTPSHALGSHRPFRNDLPTIEGFHDEIEVMASLQRPRKITLRGSDGRDYIFLCKPADDLRKDSRIMELNSMINKLLKKDPETRKRGLHIRTYAVVPLNEECGLIEWVNHMVGFRHILLSLYKHKGITVSHSEIKQLLEKKDAAPEDIFVRQLLPKFPPVFHDWFLESFPEPSQWLASRLSYTGTAAVMSMVGHIVGLGDRHGENILFDERSGACLHVDLNCVFDKGLEFEKPERVPFRLTHNMVDAFGLCGVDGGFRRACEETLRLLQGNHGALMSVLETFLHDPLCEWSKSRRSGPPREDHSEHESAQARRILLGIDRKLSGHVVQVGLPLSVQGQVHELIAQATSAKNLSQMYIGWAPYL